MLTYLTLLTFHDDLVTDDYALSLNEKNKLTAVIYTLMLMFMRGLYKPKCARTYLYLLHRCCLSALSYIDFRNRIYASFYELVLRHRHCFNLL